MIYHFFLVKFMLKLIKISTYVRAFMMLVAMFLLVKLVIKFSKCKMKNISVVDVLMEVDQSLLS